MTIKNKILVYGPNEVDPFKELPEHSGKEPFIHLKHYLENLGYEISLFSVSLVDEAAWIFVWDIPGSFQSSNCVANILHPLRYLLSKLRGFIKNTKFEKILNLCIKSGLKDRLALILWEPPAVLPHNYNHHLHSKFKYIFTWNDEFVDNKKYLKYYWPQNGNNPTFIDKAFSERKLIVNISGNKSSSHPEELYSERNKFIRYCEKAIPDQFDLFGPGWSSDSFGESYPSWQGVVINKSDVYSNYKFGLVYENMKNIKGWVSEKIFDCIRCGCVPIYWGASNIEYYVDQKSFIDRRMFRGEQELLDYIMSMTEKDWLTFREAGTDYIKSDLFKKFLPENFSITIANKLCNINCHE